MPTPLAATASGRVGVVLPADGAPRWELAADTLTYLLDSAGVDVVIAFGDSESQDERIEELVVDGVDALLVSPVDPLGLSESLGAAEAAGIPVIAFDDLPMNAEGVDFFVAPDLYGLGSEAGLAITTALGLTDAQGNPTGVPVSEPLRIEAFGADIDDWDYWFVYNGYMQNSLGPFLSSGDVVFGSGQVEGHEQATPGGSEAVAQDRMEALLASSYSQGEKLSAVLTTSPEIAEGVRAALVGTPQEDAIVVTLGDDPGTIARLGEGVDATVFSDIRTLARDAAETVVATLSDTQDDLPRGYDYFTNVGAVTTRLTWPQIVTADTRQATIIDTWYYTSDQLG